LGTSVKKLFILKRTNFFISWTLYIFSLINCLFIEFKSFSCQIIEICSLLYERQEVVVKISKGRKRTP
jgi:hypothetical protein